jgi:hypothetical protein
MHVSPPEDGQPQSFESIEERTDKGQSLTGIWGSKSSEALKYLHILARSTISEMFLSVITGLVLGEESLAQISRRCGNMGMHPNTPSVRVVG